MATHQNHHRLHSNVQSGPISTRIKVPREDCDATIQCPEDKQDEG